MTATKIPAFRDLYCRIEKPVNQKRICFLLAKNFTIFAHSCGERRRAHPSLSRIQPRTIDSIPIYKVIGLSNFYPLCLRYEVLKTLPATFHCFNIVILNYEIDVVLVKLVQNAPILSINKMCKLWHAS